MNTATSLANPYWDRVSEIETDWTGTSPMQFDRRSGREYRASLVRRYSWAIPSPDALLFVAQHASGAGLVEIGAGTGYWAHLLSELGVPVLAFDEAPPRKGHRDNHWHQNTPALFPVTIGNTRTALDHPDRSLFLCWPPYASSMAAMALGDYAEAGGTRLIYIGEDEGGCTADPDFFSALYAGWTRVAEHALPQWSGMHDQIQVWDRSE